jgi:hypothetical protein
MFTTWSTKGIDLDVWLVQLLKKIITTITLGQGVLCVREFPPNSKNASKSLDRTSTHARRATGVVVRTHISL